MKFIQFKREQNYQNDLDGRVQFLQGFENLSFFCTSFKNAWEKGAEIFETVQIKVVLIFS